MSKLLDKPGIATREFLDQIEVTVCFQDPIETFPGGKMEPGETREEALIREIKEELDADILVQDFVMTVDYTYPKFHLTMHCFTCKLVSEEIVLKEHEAAKWLDSENLDAVNWLPADLELIEEIKNRNLLG